MEKNKFESWETTLEKEATIALQSTLWFCSEMEKIKADLLDIHDNLYSIIEAQKNKGFIEFSKPFNSGNRNIVNLKDFPETIWFSFNGGNYFIDFTISSTKIDNTYYLKGILLYGTAYYNEKWKVEERPLLSFTIDNDGIISEKQHFEGESWTNSDNHLIDLHVRSLNKIAESGLYYLKK